MKNKAYLLVAFICLVASSCKKDAPKQQIQAEQIQTLEAGLIHFSINGELLGANIDTVLNTITAIIPAALNKQSLTVNFSVASQVTAALNKVAVSSGTIVDFSIPVVLTVTSADRKRTTSFVVNIITDQEYIGLTGTLIAGKSLNKNYLFYLDQFDGSTWQAINCGPTVTTMALKWADPTFTKTPADARNLIRSAGGWWFTDDITSYLKYHGINSTIDTLSNLDSLVKTSIDNGNPIVLCLDMFSVPLNDINYQHNQKFYQTNGAGWGYFLLVKGYRKLDNAFYLEIYDPYSGGQNYSGIFNNQLKGQDRYYLSNSIKTATGVWWPYAIIVGRKGQTFATGKLKVNGINKPTPRASGQ